MGLLNKLSEFGQKLSGIKPVDEQSKQYKKQVGEILENKDEKSEYKELSEKLYEDFNIYVDNAIKNIKNIEEIVREKLEKKFEQSIIENLTKEDLVNIYEEEILQIVHNCNYEIETIVIILKKIDDFTKKFDDKFKVLSKEVEKKFKELRKSIKKK
ncbi:hypothetical protein DLH72_03035 [Candidatus Gracilibacteria bacterium]|nr:MAG: hypothetical protein DLH72_03035 [Candidatus Gracilibacteria bacterium]